MLAVCCVAWLALGAGGCSRDPDQATVDFSKTLPVARPTPSAGEAGALRGAVAAMISPPGDLARLHRHLGDRPGRPPFKGHSGLARTA